ncbi:excisionase [Mycoplasmopsis arginini]|uniref:excisionase n=1 Tax=Mycoplasmopsis arginini TaxID=2094 RepID=UPI0005C26A77|nr:excisionase [Mycoplasmopsis arginini]BAQ54589.1 hypothetical protein MARG145_0644 [Mycoplasmopsis arginini]
MEKTKLKMPTWKELQLNIKALLIKNDPKTFEEWKTLFQKEFLFKLKKWMINNNIDFQLIPKYYNVLFYWSFINHRREEELIKLLTKNSFRASRTKLKTDAILKIDLFLEKDNIKYAVQLKNQINNLTSSEKRKIIEFCKKQNLIPVLIIKQQNKYKCFNLSNNSEIGLINN